MIDQAEKVTEYELQVGRALDTLKSDYPDMLKQTPRKSMQLGIVDLVTGPTVQLALTDLFSSSDFSIYHPAIEVVDPSGFTLNGIQNYKQAFNLVHGIINVFYCPEKSLLTFRIVYDCARHNIRVSWNAEVVPKAIFGGDKTTLHVDGISVYELDDHGKVVQHRVEHLMINDKPVETEQGIFHALTATCVDPECGTAVFFGGDDDRFIVNFLSNSPSSKSLFAADNALTLEALSTSSSGADRGSEHPDLDWEAMENKNRSRKKFGLKPLTPEEFLEIEAQVKQMEMQELSKHKAMNDAAEVPPPKQKKNGFLSKLFGEVFEDTCESNFDCQRPQVCCDFGFKKMCCSSGAMVGHSRDQMQPVRIPITKDDGYFNDY